MEVNRDQKRFGYHNPSKRILCSAEERHSYRFGKREGEEIMTDFSFLGELTLLIEDVLNNQDSS